MIKILVVDIGNSRIKVGLTTPAGGDWDLQVFHRHEAAEVAAAAEGADVAFIASSGGEAPAASLSSMLESRGIKSKVLRAELPAGFTSMYGKGMAGIDRVANVVAAGRLYSGAVIVVDAGSAITTEAVTADHCFLGGAIFPGLRLQAEALNSGTGTLPLSVTRSLGSPVATNTHDAIAAGIYHGCAGAIERLVSQTLLQDGMAGARLIFTGGDGPRLADWVRLENIQVDQHHTLKGLLAMATVQYPELTSLPKPLSK